MLGGRYQGIKPNPIKYSNTPSFTPVPSLLNTAPAPDRLGQAFLLEWYCVHSVSSILLALNE